MRRFGLAVMSRHTLAVSIVAVALAVWGTLAGCDGPYFIGAGGPPGAPGVEGIPPSEELAPGTLDAEPPAAAADGGREGGAEGTEGGAEVGTEGGAEAGGEGGAEAGAEVGAEAGAEAGTNPNDGGSVD